MLIIGYKPARKLKAKYEKKGIHLQVGQAAPNPNPGT